MTKIMEVMVGNFIKPIYISYLSPFVCLDLLNITVLSLRVKDCILISHVLVQLPSVLYSLAFPISVG